MYKEAHSKHWFDPCPGKPWECPDVVQAVLFWQKQGWVLRPIGAAGQAHAQPRHKPRVSFCSVSPGSPWANYRPTSSCGDDEEDDAQSSIGGSQAHHMLAIEDIQADIDEGNEWAEAAEGDEGRAHSHAGDPDGESLGSWNMEGGRSG